MIFFRKLLLKLRKKLLTLILLSVVFIAVIQFLFLEHFKSKRSHPQPKENNGIGTTLTANYKTEPPPSGVSRPETTQNSKRQETLPSQSQVKYLNNVITICDSREEKIIESDQNKRYVFFIPHTVNKEAEIDVLAEKDQISLSKVSKFLDTFPEFDGATCFMEGKKTFLHRQVNDSWCRYVVRESTLIIRNTGPWFESKSFQYGPIQHCNITKGPFIMRKNIFMTLGWRPRYGKTSIYDFFVRSRGKLKIARLSGCLFSDDLGRIDRGTEEGTGDFPDYIRFADGHGIFRIIMEDRVEWTKCVADSVFCKEKPFVRPKTLPRAGMPLCCSHALDRMLRDMVWAINKVGLRYRLIYGTLLGAIRNRAIIPWTHDVDIALNRTLLQKPNWNEKLQKVLQGRYYVGISFMNLPRAIPLIPTYITVNTTSFFSGSDDIFGEKFFSKYIVNAMERSHATGHSWRDRGYIDFYEAPEIWWNGSSLITINGQKYISIRDIHYELDNWYGKDYMRPVLSAGWIGLSDAGNR